MPTTVDNFFYTKVLFAFCYWNWLTAGVEIAPQGGVSKQKIDDAKSALGELMLNAM